MATLPITNPDVPPSRQTGLCQFLNMKEENIRFILLAVLLFLYLAVGAFVFQAAEEPAEKKLRDDFVTLYYQFVHNLTGLHSLAFGFDGENNDSNNNDFSGASSSGAAQNAGDGGGSNGVIDNFISNNSNNGGNRSSANIINADGMYNVNNNKNNNRSAVTELWNSNRHQFIDKSTSSSSAETFYARQPPSIESLHELLFAYGNATQAGVIWKRRRWDYVGSFHFTWTIVSTIGKLSLQGVNISNTFTT